MEWPTLFLAVVIYGGWAALTWWHAVVPLPLLALLGGAIIAWHGSLQHETIHGHPTGRAWVDSTIGFAPLSLWLPYAIYRRSHIAHHSTERITDPLDDPESQYLPGAGGWRHWMARVEATLIGRLILGPPIRTARFLGEELLRLRREPLAWARDWLPHLAAIVPLLWWLDHVGLSLGTYVMAFVYPGTALSLLRSFAEHRADADPGRRAAIVERAGLFGWLFLNNNLHAVHHARPGLAWYSLPAYYRAHRAQFLSQQGVPLYNSYGEIIRRFAWRGQDDIVHPDYRHREGMAG